MTIFHDVPRTRTLCTEYAIKSNKYGEFNRKDIERIAGEYILTHVDGISTIWRATKMGLSTQPFTADHVVSTKGKYTLLSITGDIIIDSRVYTSIVLGGCNTRRYLIHGNKHEPGYDIKQYDIDIAPGDGIIPILGRIYQYKGGFNGISLKYIYSQSPWSYTIPHLRDLFWHNGNTYYVRVKNDSVLLYMLRRGHSGIRGFPIEKMASIPSLKKMRTAYKSYIIGETNEAVAKHTVAADYTAYKGVKDAAVRLINIPEYTYSSQLGFTIVMWTTAEYVSMQCSTYKLYTINYTPIGAQASSNVGPVPRNTIYMRGGRPPYRFTYASDMVVRCVG